MELPKSPREHILAEEAVTLCKSVFLKNGWLFRSQSGESDYGIDAEVELRHRNRVTGKLFKCQVKGTEDGDRTSVRVSERTYNYWKCASLPVFLLLANPRSGTVLWSFPLSVVPMATGQTVTLRLEAGNDLAKDFAAFSQFALSLGPSADWLTGTFRDFPYFHFQWSQTFCKERRWQPDFGHQAEEALDRDAEHFHQHVLQLRAGLGLATTEVVPFEWFRIRNNAFVASINRDEPTLTYEVLGELMDHLAKPYGEAVERFVERLEGAEITFENLPVLRYLASAEGLPASVQRIANHFPKNYWMSERPDLNEQLTIERRLASTVRPAFSILRMLKT